MISSTLVEKKIVQSFASEFQTHRVVSEALVEPTVLSGELGAVQKPEELGSPEANIVKALFGGY